MIRYFTVTLLLLVGQLSTAQLENRVEITGQIVVEGGDLEDITIYNTTSKKGTLSNAKGEFSINVKVNDTVQVRGLQYQDFDVIINNSIVQSRRLSIFLIQEVNQLDEIVIRNTKLTGQLNADISKVKTFKPKMDAVYYGVRQEPKLNESKSEFARNDILITSVTSQNKPLVNGLDLVNVVDQLLLPLFRSEVKNKEKVGVPEVPVEAIKYYFGSEFLSRNFNIPKHRVEEFIRYVERENFDFTLLNYGRELEFLELINQKSIAFLNQSKKTGN